MDIKTIAQKIAEEITKQYVIRTEYTLRDISNFIERTMTEAQAGKEVPSGIEQSKPSISANAASSEPATSGLAVDYPASFEHAGLRYSPSQPAPPEAQLCSECGNFLCECITTTAGSEPAEEEWIRLTMGGFPEELLSKAVIFGWEDLQSVSQGFMTTSNEACSPMGIVFKHRPSHWQPLPAAPLSQELAK